LQGTHQLSGALDGGVRAFHRFHGYAGLRRHHHGLPDIECGHRPRHAKVYRNFRAEFDRLQSERIAAFKEFRADVETGAYPEDKHLVPIADPEFEAFLLALPD